MSLRSPGACLPRISGSAKTRYAAAGRTVPESRPHWRGSSRLAVATRTSTKIGKTRKAIERRDETRANELAPRRRPRAAQIADRSLVGSPPQRIGTESISAALSREHTARWRDFPLQPAGRQVNRGARRRFVAPQRYRARSATGDDGRDHDVVASSAR